MKNDKMQYRLRAHARYPKGGIRMVSCPNSHWNPVELPVTTERIKTLKVIGEAVGEVVVENQIPICAVKIDRIRAKLGTVTDHFFTNKIVKQGTISKEIFFVDREGVLRFLEEEVPFMLTVDIPGFEPDSFTEVQNHLLDIDVDFILHPASGCRRGCLQQKIVAKILVIAAKWVQLDVLTGVKRSSGSIIFSRNNCHC
jgi:hypothetical protein